MQDNFASSVHYTVEDYQKLRKTYDQWWKWELSRPIVPIITYGHESNRKPSENPLLSFKTAWDMNITPQQLVDAHDDEFSKMRFHGDAFPYINFDAFGPGVLSAFMGCRPVPHEDTVWFEFDKKETPIEELHFEFNENSPYFRRMMNVYEAAMEKWRGAVVLGMADLSGMLDNLAYFRGTENLLMDLYDDPDEIQRCVKEIQDAWFKCYNKIVEMLGSEVMGYSHWYKMYCEKPSYILQCDFSYMISPDMFETFAAPELEDSASRFTNAIYHMDGIGEIPHLDMLLNMEHVKGIQWIPGAGEPSTRDWSELVEKIIKSGKKLISWNKKADGTPIDVAPDPGQLYYVTEQYSLDQMDEARRYGGLYGITL